MTYVGRLTLLFSPVCVKLLHKADCVLCLRSGLGACQFPVIIPAVELMQQSEIAKQTHCGIFFPPNLDDFHHPFQDAASKTVL